MHEIRNWARVKSRLDPLPKFSRELHLIPFPLLRGRIQLYHGVEYGQPRAGKIADPFVVDFKYFS